MRFPVHLMLALGVLAAPACASNPKPSDTVGQDQQVETTRVRVENRNFADMEIYVLREGQRVRIGLATGNSTSTFTLPKYLMQVPTDLRFLADPIGSRDTPVSDVIHVEPGETVTLTIPAS